METDKMLENMLIAMTHGGIEAQEKRGQSEFVATDKLPIQGTSDRRELLESLGFEFGENIDELFVAIKLPPGWKKEADAHSMWSSLIDEHGRKRASIFYKAAFYDRDAFIQWSE